MSTNEERAQAAKDFAYALGDMLYEKQLAYGDSGAIALGLWQARLAQYLNAEGTHYTIPVELIAHIPRITRLDDRINRLISNPAGDRLGEDPWKDAAGDAVIGAISPRVRGGLGPYLKAEPVPALEAIVLRLCHNELEADIGFGPQTFHCDLPLGHFSPKHRKLRGHQTIQWENGGRALGVFSTGTYHTSPGDDGAHS